MSSTLQYQVDEVDREIESISQVLSRIPDGDPTTRLLLLMLVNAHDKRFDLREAPHDIQKVIEYTSIILTITPDDSPDMLHLLSTLGIAHSQRFQRLGDMSDLDKSIEYKSRAIELLPLGHPDLARQLINLALAHKNRFEHFGNPGDIQTLIEYCFRAVKMTPMDDPDLPEWLEKLGLSHICRFGRFGELDDLEKALEYGSRALVLTPDDHPDLPSRLTNLAVSHGHRFRRLGDLSDLEQAIKYQSHTLALTSDDCPELPIHLANLAVCHRDRFQRLGDVDDLNQAIEYEFRALALTPDDHPDFLSRFVNLAASHSHRFQRLGDLGDLEQAIKYHSNALGLTSDDHPNIPRLLADLAVSHSHRFKRLGDLSDLEQAIEYESRALNLTPNDHPDLLHRLANLAVSHSDRFQCLGDLTNLEQAIEYESRALKLTPDDHPDLSHRLANLAVSHSDRFQCLGNLIDLDHAIEYESRALALASDDHQDLSSRLGNLAVSHKYRFQHLGEIRDLDQAIDYGARALASITEEHPNSCLWHFNQALFYFDYYELTKNLSYLQRALSYFRSSSTLLAGPPRDRFENACGWACRASMYSPLIPMEAYQVTINLLPQFIWLGGTLNQRYQDLKKVNTLAIDAAHVAILSSNSSLALEWLEHARCVVWKQNLMLHSPLDLLEDSHPSIATRLQAVAKQLHSFSSDSRESQALASSMTTEQITREHHRLAKEYEELLAQVRIQPGFEDFLQPMRVGMLVRAARNGPIAVINCYKDRCDALLISPGQGTITHLGLPNFSGKLARYTRFVIDSSLKRQGIRERGVRVQKELGYNEELGRALAILWHGVVNPILDFWGLTDHLPTDNLPHITWCPTGALSFLPLHAAGDYDQPCSRVFDYVVSSYTPALTALFSTTPSTLSCKSRVLAISQAATPYHSPLPGTTAELNNVRSHIESRAGYSELTDAQATPSAVLDAMENHDWVHIACHAHQNVDDPTKSGFFLHGGTLDLATINRRSFKKKGLAFLSACQTATGDETLPDEAVHLASGMLMAGYSSVIATMWSVGDKDAPFVADKVYNQLMVKRTLGNGEAGKALHHAVAALRGQIGEKEFGRWVPFIHIGS